MQIKPIKMELLRTKKQIQREERDKAIRADYEAMMRVEGQSKTEVTKLLMEKYDIASPSTIYIILKRTII